jgi:hypothetical protein
MGPYIVDISSLTPWKWLGIVDGTRHKHVKVGQLVILVQKVKVGEK